MSLLFLSSRLQCNIDSISKLSQLAVALMYNLEIDCMDVLTAFLYGELDELVYMKPFPGMAETNAEGKTLIFRLKKSLYGLHQASRQWNKTLAVFFN
jgi:hypothetical protein